MVKLEQHKFLFIIMQMTNLELNAAKNTNLQE